MHNGATVFSACLKVEAGQNHCYPRYGTCPSDQTACPALAGSTADDPWGACKDKKKTKKCLKNKAKGRCDCSSKKCKKTRKKCKATCNVLMLCYAGDAGVCSCLRICDERRPVSRV